MQQTFEKHKLRISKLKDFDEVSNLIELWECEYDAKLKNDDNFYSFVNDNEIREPLEPRDALAGGRTNAFVLHHEGSMGYVDFTSLYPYIQKYGYFPLGHPEIITEY